MIIFRYLLKELLTTLVALTSVLLLIFISNQGIQYLNRASSGQFPALFVLKLMMLEIPNLLGLLLPLGFYMSIMLAYGRLYAESEMTALAAGGYGSPRLLRDSFYIATIVASVVAVLIFACSPWIAKERVRLLTTAGLQTLIQTITPGRFQSISNGTVVFYVESMTGHPKIAHHVFLAKQNVLNAKERWQILWAKEGRMQHNHLLDEEDIIFKNGRIYIGVPGEAQFQWIEFETNQMRLPPPVEKTSHDIRMYSMSDLFAHFHTDHKMAAELQWRLSIPIMVFLLTAVAVPLSRVNPRSGKFARILPALLIFTIYANFMFVGRNWIASGVLPMWLVPLCLHGSLALVAYGLWRQADRIGMK